MLFLEPQERYGSLLELLRQRLSRDMTDKEKSFIDWFSNFTDMDSYETLMQLIKDIKK